MIRIVVGDEHTLGYIDDRLPTVLQTLHSSILRGATFGNNALVSMYSKVRTATSADFETYRVSEDGFDKDENYIYFRTKKTLK